jgi:hypothetical protein
MSPKFPSQRQHDRLENSADDEAAPGYGVAIVEIRAAIAKCEEARIPVDSVLAALMAELMPRLVAAYGPAGVASVLGRVAGEISRVGKTKLEVQ